MLNYIKDWLDRRSERIRQERIKRVDVLKDMLSQIPTGKELLALAEEKNFYISFVSGLNSLAKYLPRTRIQLSYVYPISRQAPILAHELRHAWQEFNGLALRQKKDALDNIVNVRFGEADAFATEAQVAWELTQYKVDPEAWTVFKKHNKEIATAYERAVKASPKAVTSGLARSRAFEAWFKTGHKDSYDQSALEQVRVYAARSRNGQRIAREFDAKRPEGAPSRRSAAFLRQFGKTANGQNYLDYFNFQAHHMNVTSKRTSRALTRHLRKARA